MHATSLSHTVHQISVTDYDVTYERTTDHIIRLEYTIGSNVLYLFSVTFIDECLYNAVFVYGVQFLLNIMWYNRGERRLFHPPSGCLRF